MRAYGAGSNGSDVRSLKEQGLTVREIATSLNVTEKTIRARLAAAA